MYFLTYDKNDPRCSRRSREIPKRSHHLPRVSRASPGREHLNKPVNSPKASSSEITSRRSASADILTLASAARTSFFRERSLAQFLPLLKEESLKGFAARDRTMAKVLDLHNTHAYFRSGIPRAAVPLFIKFRPAVHTRARACTYGR